MTKAKILAQFEVELKLRYWWTKDAERLERFMDMARDMLDTGRGSVSRDGAAWKAALKHAGLPQDMTLTGLMALPAGE